MMLTIQYQGVKNKEISFHDGAINLRKNVCLYLKGETKQVRYFLHTLQMGSKTISFTQSNKVLDNKTVLQRTVFLSYPTTLDPNQCIESVLLHAVSDDEATVILTSCGLEEKRMQKMKTLTIEEGMMLQLYLYASLKPALWVFDKTWENASATVLGVLQDIMHDEVQAGCYLLSASNLNDVFVNYDEASLGNASSSLPITTYLEDDVKIEPRHSIAKKKHHNFLSSRLILRCVFLLLVMISSFLSFNYAFAGRYQIQTIEKELATHIELKSFPFQIRYCQNETTYAMLNSGFDCNGYPMEEARDSLTSIISPLTANIIPQFETIILLREDEFYFYDENNRDLEIRLSEQSNFRSNLISTFDEDPRKIGSVLERYQEDGIFLTRYFLESFDSDFDLSNATLHAKIAIPVYSYSVKETAYAGITGVEEEFYRYQPIYRVVELDMPIAGIVEDTVYGICFMEQSMLEHLLEEAEYGKPYDDSLSDSLYTNMGERLLGGVESEEVQIYYPNNYQIEFSNQQDAIQGKQIFEQYQKNIAVMSYFTDAEENIGYVYKMQQNIRNFLTPYVIASIILTLVVAWLLRHKHRKHNDISIERTNWKKQCMYPLLVASGVCFLQFLILDVCKENIIMMLDSFSQQFSMNNYMLSPFWQVYGLVYNSIYSLHLDGLTTIALFLFTFVLVSFVYVQEWIYALRHRLRK